MIDVKNLRFTYAKAGTPALDGLNFAIERGEIFGFLGPSGAGKSTTQKILIGLLKGYQGRVAVFEQELADWGQAFYERVGVAFELPNHFCKLTALENLAYFSVSNAIAFAALLGSANIAGAATPPLRPMLALPSNVIITIEVNPMHALQILKGRGPLDAKTVGRDSLLRGVIGLPLLIAFLTRLVVPILAQQISVATGFDVSAYQTPIMSAALLLITPTICGLVIGFLQLDQRDDCCWPRCCGASSG